MLHGDCDLIFKIIAGDLYQQKLSPSERFTTLKIVRNIVKSVKFNFKSGKISKSCEI